MFKVGETYTITIVEDAVGQAEAAETQYGGCKIIAVEWPCIRYERSPGDITVLNVSSPRFMKAELSK